MNKISRGKMSKIFNINKETLRYYSDIGLLKPKVNPVNKYSEYTMEDVFLLSTILRGRYIGTSISNIKEIKNSDDIYVYESFIELQLEKIETEIARLKEIKTIINKNKESISMAKDFENNFDFKNQKSKFVKKVFYRFDTEKAIENLIRHKEFMDISEKQKIFIMLDPKKENIFSDIDYLYLENDADSNLIEYLMRVGIDFVKTSFEGDAIVERFLGSSLELKDYINEIISYHNLNEDEIMINKELTIPNENADKYFVEIFIKL